MREGLRSGKLRERPQKDEGASGEVLVQKKLFDVAWEFDKSRDVSNVVLESTDVGAEDVGAEKLDDRGTCNGEVEDVNGCEHHEALEAKKKRKRECGKGSEFLGSDRGTCGDEGEDVDACEHHEASECKKKRKREECGRGNECLVPEKMNGREGVSEGEMQTGGRVLRSRTRANAEVAEEMPEYKATAVGKKRGFDSKKGMKRVKTEEEDDESYEPVGRVAKKNPKWKQVASGRAPKRRGRPLLSQGTLGISRNQRLKKRTVGVLRKSQRNSKIEGNMELRRLTRSSNRETSLGKDSSNSRNPSLNEDKFSDVEMHETSPVRSLDAGNVVSFHEDGITQKKGSDEDGVAEAGKCENDEGDVGLSRASEKQLVRDRIMHLLFDAGWTVDYRPRNGRLYNDAVYVSPDGKTHWSITLAYRVLKQRYEDGDTEAYKEGFIFSPIPKADLDMLKRVQVKIRNSKERQVLKTTGRLNRVVAMKNKKKKKNKGELHSRSSACKKSFDGRMKRKRGDSTDAHGASPTLGIRKRRETHNRKGYAILVRRSDGAESDADGYVLYNGKRTALAWTIDSGVVAEKAKVSYMNPKKARAMLQGKITRDGIDCGCCGEVVTISEFESHAGSKLCRPLENILVENGSSILQYQLDAWNKLESKHNWFHLIDVDGDDPNDDTCGICGDGGNLVCCDGCPSTFHQNCLDIQKFPSGDWYCPHCICKYCGRTRTTQRSAEGTEASLLTCCLCEEKYHTSCIHADDALMGEFTFCGRKCQEICGKIENLLGVKHELEDGFSWTLVRRCEVSADISSSEVPRKIECNSKLAVALSVMDECFLPCPDHRTGANLIHNIIYSCRSNFNRLNYGGFYTVTLEMGDEIVAVASIRIHGNILVEMPYIGTRYKYRRQGMCRRLLAAVEWILRFLNVAKLVIPAISELKETWTSVFGFEPLDASTQRRMRSMNVLVFPGVNLLQKPMLNHQFTGESAVDAEGLIASEGEDHQTANEAMKVSDSNNIFLEKLDTNVASEVTVVNDANGAERKISVPKLLLNVSSNDLSDITSESIDCTNCPNDNISPAQTGEPCDTLEDQSGNIGILDIDCDDWKQAKVDIDAHHRSDDSDSLPLMSESEKSHPQSEGTNCCPPDSAELDRDFACEVKVGSCPLGPSVGTDCDNWKQAEEDIDVHHRSAESDSLPLISESEKSHLSSELDRDFACEVKVRSSPLEPSVGSRDKDSEEHAIDGGQSGRLRDSSAPIASNGFKPTVETPNETDGMPEVRTDETDGVHDSVQGLDEVTDTRESY